jgi:AraC family transcriptional regulator, transcriptional activator of the genes for pyochelin and ferripyochelin receptors
MATLTHISFSELQQIIMANCVSTFPFSENGLFHTVFESKINDPVLGTGMAKNVLIRPEITLNITQLQPNQAFQITVEFERPVIGLNFYLSGKARSFVPDLGRFVTFDADCANILKAPASQGWQEIYPGQEYHVVTIHFSVEAFRQLIGDHFNDLAEEFRQGLEDDKGYFIRQGKITPELLSSLHLLLNCPYQGLSRQFFIESKVLELVAYQVDNLLKRPKNNAADILTKEDHEKLELCRSILIANYSHPPSLLELARQIGMNDFKLKAGFKFKFGSPVYKYLQDYRMHQAKAFLEEGKMNVSEVADAIGYSSIGSFSNAFFDKFGIRPSQLRE